MNPNALPPVLKPRRRWRILKWCLAAFAVLAAVAVWQVASLFFLSRDARVLRDAVRAANRGEMRKQIELSLGRLPFGLVRSGASFVKLDPEAKAAISSVRGAEVGVYAFPQEALPATRGAFMARAGAAMERRGWTRVVGVTERNQSVAVFVPDTADLASTLRVMVLVVDKRQCVIASARIHPEPLVELAHTMPFKSQLALPGGGRLAAVRTPGTDTSHAKDHFLPVSMKPRDRQPQPILEAAEGVR
jgi:hypothetical protein